MTLSNLDIAHLLSQSGDGADDFRRKAYRRAARAALGWPEEAADVRDRGESLETLYGLGPRLAARVKRWLEDPPEIDDPPEVRTGFSTMAEARRYLAEQPDWAPRNRGDLQMHTTRSDGKASVHEMAIAGIELGHSYIGITDHSKGLKIAGGMDEAELQDQTAEIDEVNAELERSDTDFRVLRSLEMNISPDGSGDMEPEALAKLDLVLGSFHSKLRITEDQTERYLAALDNPDIQVLGHPRGRQFNFRLGLKADWGTVFEAAAEHGKAVEIDCHPNRQDLNIELLELVRDAGAHVSIGTDAHAQFEMDFIDIGLAAALRAGISPDKVINFMPAEDLIRWAHDVRRRT